MSALFSYLKNCFRNFKQKHKQAKAQGNCEIQHYAGQIILDADAPYRSAVGSSLEAGDLQLQQSQTVQLSQPSSIEELQQEYGAELGATLFHSLQVYSVPPSTSSQPTPQLAEV